MKILIAIATIALIISLWSLANPREVITERTVIIEREVQPIITYNVTASIPAPATTESYRWVESEGMRQWRSSIKTSDKYLPEHFGVELGDSGHWELVE
ncbi:MAG: hypothetical protein KAY32_15385 [Candidatus Eisenbacteria sp.]|nr:hypothetical protein [Candidatus Eisenbacteria bacterium]